MIITHCKATKYNIKLKKPFSYNLATLEYLPYVLIRMETDKGIVGWGEAAIGWDTTGEMQNGSLEIFEFIKPILLESRIENIDDIMKALGDINKIIYENTALKSGIEMAMLDILGKYIAKIVKQQMER